MKYFLEDMDNKNHLQLHEKENNSFESSFQKPSNDFIFESVNPNISLSKHSDIFQKQGEKLLQDGDFSGLKFFDMAIDLDPTNPYLYYDQGITILHLTDALTSNKNLLLSCKKFKKATKLDPQFFAAWLAWGETLLQLGIAENKNHFFLDAKSKLEKALSCLDTATSQNQAKLYWLYGKTMLKISKHSLEVSDLNKALEYFSLASAHNEQKSHEFWIDFGIAYNNLGIQINDFRLFVKAADCFRHSTSLQSSFLTWKYLGKALHHLYQYTSDEDHFLQSSECFGIAAQMNPENVVVWLDWAKLLFHSGKKIGDPKRLFSSIEKCHKANSCETNNLSAIAIWSESLSQLGVLLDRIDLLHDAENKIHEVLEDTGKDSPLIWHAYGQCLYAYAQYYDELDYYYQAIEKFQEGLSIDRTFHSLWYAIGISYAQAAEIESDPEILELASKFFSRAINLCPKSEYYFEYALTLSKIGEFHGDERSLELSIYHFEKALNLQKNTAYMHPQWLYQYALTLDSLADLSENIDLYQKAIDILNHVLIMEPEHPEIHFRLALCYSHLAEAVDETDYYLRALHYYKLAYKKNDENETILLDWALTLINLSEVVDNEVEQEQWKKEAEYKLIQAAKLGSVYAFYHLACLYSLVEDFNKAIHFLEKASQFHGLPPIDELLQDNWLENLRETNLFQEFLNKIEKSAESY